MKPIFKCILTITFMLTLCACAKKNQSVPYSPENIITESLRASLQTAPVSFSKMLQELKLNGHVTVNENLEANVYALVSGKITNVWVENGDYVRKGQELATIRSIESVDISSQVLQSENQVEITKKNLRFKKELMAEKMATIQEVAQAEMEYKTALADLSRSKQLAAITGGKNGIYTLRSPVSGFIVHKSISTGSEVRSDHNEVLFTVADLSRVWVIANVFESDIQKIRQGDRVEIKTLSGTPIPYTGKIDKIYNVLDHQTRTLNVRISLPNPGYELKPGMFASVTVLNEAEEPSYNVPSQAIIMNNSKHYIIVKEGDELTPREIKIKKRINGTTYIEEVSEGEEVVIGNPVFLFDALNNKN